jgi:hypothetical protein
MYEEFVKGLDKIKTPDALSSREDQDDTEGRTRFAASRKFRDGINERLGLERDTGWNPADGTGGDAARSDEERRRRRQGLEMGV